MIHWENRENRRKISNRNLQSFISWRLVTESFKCTILLTNYCSKRIEHPNCVFERKCGYFICGFKLIWIVGFLFVFKLSYLTYKKMSTEFVHVLIPSDVNLHNSIGLTHTKQKDNHLANSQWMSTKYIKIVFHHHS